MITLKFGEVDNIFTTRNPMERAGIKTTRLKSHSWGAEVYYLSDPEGHRIAVWQAENGQI